MRPTKTTVDYFPHRTNSGRTIFILENLYGNDGYAAWFKILELLGSTAGHSYDFNSPVNFQYLSARLGLSGEKTTSILQTLSELDAIDSDLYAEKVIWSENFVDGLDAVYNKRNVEKPKKPSLRRENHSYRGENPGVGVVNGVGNTGSKVEYSRGEESREKKELCLELEKHPDSIPVLMTIPLNISNTFFEINQRDLDQWQDSFPAVDVLSEVKRCRQWNIDNPSKRKTKRGIRGHVSNWLGRCQDSGGSKGENNNNHPRPYSVKDALTIQSEEIARALNDEHRRQQQQADAANGEGGGLLLEHSAQGSGICQ